MDPGNSSWSGPQSRKGAFPEHSARRNDVIRVFLDDSAPVYILGMASSLLLLLLLLLAVYFNLILWAMGNSFFTTPYRQINLPLSERKSEPLRRLGPSEGGPSTNLF